jgi:hypothetical protein
VNLACKEEAATIKEVKGSNRMLEYDRPLGMERVGKGPSYWKFGIHSSKVGPLENGNGCEKYFRYKPKKNIPHRYRVENRPLNPTTSKR